jgi:hypothetical protein
MLYAQQGWDAEHMSWRKVIHLNHVWSMNRILDTLNNASEMEMSQTTSRMNCCWLTRVRSFSGQAWQATTRACGHGPMAVRQAAVDGQTAQVQPVNNEIGRSQGRPA